MTTVANSSCPFVAVTCTSVSAWTTSPSELAR